LLNKRVKKNAGFTLMELMIVVFIVGVLAAIGILAYNDYIVKSKISEVTNGLDTLATSVIEYHTKRGYFPNSYAVANLASLPTTYGGYPLVISTSDKRCFLTFTFNNTLSQVMGCSLIMLLTYANEMGYYKILGGDLPPRYLPRHYIVMSPPSSEDSKIMVCSEQIWGILERFKQ
jgi:type IV pilus assembly protein PilA